MLRRTLVVVGPSGLEPPTSRLSGVRSNLLSYGPVLGGDERNRTADPLLARQVLSQLSYTPIFLGSSFKSNFTQRFLYSNFSLLVFSTSPVWLLHLRKEVIQPHLPIRLPCYDFTPVIGFTFDDSLLTVRTSASGAPNFHGVTGGVYKARERIHRGVADPRLLATPPSWSRVADSNPN